MKGIYKIFSRQFTTVSPDFKEFYSATIYITIYKSGINFNY